MGCNRELVGAKGSVIVTKVLLKGLQCNLDKTYDGT